MITNYAELLTAVQNWAWRDDDDFANRCREFVALAEVALSKRLRTLNQRTTATLTAAGGAFLLPAGVEAIINVRTQNNPTIALEPITADYVDAVVGSRPGGLPIYYTLASNGLTVYPQSVGDLQITYYTSIPPLSDANPTNWLLQRSTTSYLYASLMQAAIFMQDDARIQTFATLTENAISDLMAVDVATTHSGQRLRLRGPTP